MDASALIETLTWQLAVVCGLAFVLGMIGGAIHDRTPPPASDGTASPAVAGWRRALVGGVAAVAILYLTHPETGVELAGGSLAAGYAGQAVLAALESRALALLAQAKAVEATRDVKASLAASATLIDRPRGELTPTDEAALIVADETLTRLRDKYAKEG
jgi:hypothetical protein